MGRLPWHASARALGNVLQQLPYQLTFRETVGAHPLDGGVMVFDLPGLPFLGRGPEANAVNEMLNALVAVGTVVRSEDVFGALSRDTP